MNLPKEPYLDLISKYLSREITAVEQELLTKWLQKDPANQALFDQSQEAWNQGGENLGAFEPDVDAAWDKFKHRIDLGQTENVEKEETKVIKLFPPFLLKIAASVSIFLVLSALAYYFLNKKPESVLVAATDKRTLFVLPDSSQVWLQPQSSLTYAPNSEGDTREVSLKGEGFFEVKRNEAKPFVVLGQKTRVQVLGTSFVVHSKPGDTREFVIVASGKVKFSEGEKPKNAVILTKGDEAVFQPQTPIHVETKASQNAVAWKSSRLQFDDTPLPQVLTDLELYFDIKIRASNPDLLKCRFTGTFELPTADEALNLISLSLNSSYKKDHTTYTLDGLGCPE
jgi:ferric-dicitrate binding protein FerR (iron transport regulator)